jgi:hypothetical protein
MKKVVAGGAVLAVAVLAIAAYTFLRGDPIAELLNQKWQPISVDEQRQKAIDSAAAALKSFSGASVAAGIDVKEIVALAAPLLKAQGVQALRVTGDQELLHMEADFARAFGPEDVPADFKGRDLIVSTKPNIEGMIDLSVGIAAAVPDQQTPTLQLKILPAFNSVHVKKVTLADKVDATLAVDALAFVLNRYAGNLTAALDEASILNVSLRTALPDFAGQSGPIKVSIPSVPDLKVSVSAKPIKDPFRLAGIASLVDGDHVAVIARLVPITDAPAAPSTISSTFAAMKTEFFAHLKEGLDVSALADGVWVSVSKAQIASGLNSAFQQAEPCFSAQGTVPTQSFSKTVPLPDETTMDCTPAKKCDLQEDTRDCRRSRNCQRNQDTRSCSACLLRAPTICVPNFPSGQSCSGGQCIQAGNDPICEGAKALQNQAYDRAFDACNALGPIDDLICEGEKGAQNTLYAGAKAACETEKTGLKGACETAKEGLKRISRTGKVANIDGSMGGPANLKICFSGVNVSSNLGHISLALGIEGGADVASHIKFVPLDIVGHLACPLEWTDDRTIKVTIPNQSLPVAASLAARRADGKQIYDGHVDDVTLKLHFDPSPTVVLLRNVNFALACAPAEGLINAVTFNLAPLIPELLKDFDYKIKAFDFSFTPELPDMKMVVAPLLSETSRAITLTGTVKPSASLH